MYIELLEIKQIISISTARTAAWLPLSGGGELKCSNDQQAK